MAYALSLETSSTTPICPLLSVNPHSDYVHSSPCVHCPAHITPPVCLLIQPVNSAPPVACHNSVPHSHALLAHPCSCPLSPAVRSAYLPHITPDHQWINAFPFTAKLTWPSHPKSISPRSSIAPLHQPTSKAQDTAALHSMHHTLTLAIVLRSLDLVLI